LHLQKNGSLLIVSKLFLMLTAIKFDHQLLLDAGKIDDVSSNRVLTAKTVAVKLFGA